MDLSRTLLKASSVSELALFLRKKKKSRLVLLSSFPHYEMRNLKRVTFLQLNGINSETLNNLFKFIQ